MIPEPFVALHGDSGPEIALLEYLSRVFLHLLAVGGVAVLAFWGSSAAEVVRSAFVGGGDDDPDDEETER